MCACFRCGLIWQGITHDLSASIRLIEFFLRSASIFRASVSIDAEKGQTDDSLAWQNHKAKNKAFHCWHYLDGFEKKTV